MSTPHRQHWHHVDRQVYTLVVPTVYGQMLVNRHDINQTNALIKTGRALDHHEILLMAQIMDLIPAERKTFIDVGANFGAYSLGLATHLGDDGLVYAFEAQRLIFQLLCGTMALNSITNVHAFNMAVGAAAGQIPVPQFDYFQPMNFGSVEFGARQEEILHQARGDDDARAEFVPVVALDSFEFGAAHIIKIDAEGMEFEVLEGARATIARCNPVLYVEYLKVDKARLAQTIKAFGYTLYDVQSNFLCIPALYQDRIKLDGIATL